MTRIIGDYCIFNEEGVMIDPKRKRRGGMCFRGKFVDSMAFLVGEEYCITPVVKEVSEEGEFEIQSGRYKLGNISPEYREFLKATRNGILAVANWNIYGSKERGYYLTGDVYPCRKALGTTRILAQQGNFLTIQRLIKLPDGENIWDDPEKVFVCWNSMSEQAKMQIREGKKVADIPYVKFQDYIGIKCKPLFN